MIGDIMVKYGHDSYTWIIVRHAEILIESIWSWSMVLSFSFLFSLILGTKTHWIFWRAPEHGSSIRARFSFLFQIARSKYQ